MSATMRAAAEIMLLRQMPNVAFGWADYWRGQLAAAPRISARDRQALDARIAIWTDNGTAACECADIAVAEFERLAGEPFDAPAIDQLLEQRMREDATA